MQGNGLSCPAGVQPAANVWFSPDSPDSQQTRMKSYLYATDATERKSVKKAEVGQAGRLSGDRCLPPGLTT